MTTDVLLVDDDRDVLEALEARFVLAGLKVVACASYIEAIDHVTVGFPGCIVTDLRMPGKTGLDLIQKAHSIDPELPVILLTGFAQTETTVNAMRNGALTVLEKPCSMECLLTTVSDALQHRRSVLKTRIDRAKRQVRDVTGRVPKDTALTPLLAEYERELIRRSLRRNSGNKEKTARELGISRSQLYAKIAAYDLKDV